MARSPLLPGTLDMMILRTLVNGEAHGHQITRSILELSEGVLKVEHGSLYPALHRMERQGWVAANWEGVSKYYRLTPGGTEQLQLKESQWRQLTGAIARVMEPAGK